MTTQLSFSGHQTFTCKQFWLKKGYQFVKNKKKFTDKNAVVDLGVGKNMVASIHFWLKSFAILDNEGITEIADFIFDDQKGKDVYLEDISTIWLLHYLLIKTEKASIYSLFFNEFLKEKPTFTREQLKSWLVKRTESKVAENSLHKDIEVLLRTYQKPKKVRGIEKDFINIFVTLNLLSEIDKKITININEKKNLAPAIFLYAILDNKAFENTNSINIKELRFSRNSVGLIFGLTLDAIYEKIHQIVDLYPNQIIFTETAGTPVLQFKEKIDKMTVLNDYYNHNH
ncbi:MAG: DUF4007 family protein [Cytophagia bacterium]|nr:MAG: DUF4007 family protein [Cytophagia bacterium]TAH30801.1 MAG: DUF4007 family protein [Cytophagales bacterium]